MTPLIDMVFILLIFFVVTTTFSKDTGIEIDRPKAKVVTNQEREPYKVAIDSSGNYWSNQKEITLDDLIPQIIEQKREDTALTLLLVPDKRSQVEPLITLMDKLREHDISKFAIAADQKEND